jgi:hypothetical protein
MALWLRADGVQQTIVPEGPNGRLTLLQLEVLVGGKVELVRLHEHKLLIIQDAPMRTHLQVNERASAWARSDAVIWLPTAVIHGNAVLCDLLELEDGVSGV